MFNRNVQPVCLLRPGIEFPTKEECHVVGWGHTEWNGTQPEIVRQAKVQLPNLQWKGMLVPVRINVDLRRSSE